MSTIGDDTAVDRGLMIADLTGFAKSTCSRCHGAGFVTKVFHATGKGETRIMDACMCALRRLKKKHGANIVLVDGAPHWKAGTAPAFKT